MSLFFVSKPLDIVTEDCYSCSSVKFKESIMAVILLWHKINKSGLSNTPWRRYWFLQGRILHRRLLLVHALWVALLAARDRLVMYLFVAIIAGNIFGWTKSLFVALTAAEEALTVWVWFLEIWSLATITFAVTWSRLIDVINVATLLFSSNDRKVRFSCFGLATYANGVCECEVWFCL